MPEDSTLRWEKCPVVDPVAFVQKRLPTARPDDDWSTPYVAWAEYAALVPHATGTRTHLDAALLDRALERAGVAREADSAGDDHAHPATRGDSSSAGHTAVGWTEVAHSLGALRGHPVRLPPCPVSPKQLAEACRSRLGVRRPSRDLPLLAQRDPTPTVAELCLALADFAPAAPRPARRTRPHRMHHAGVPAAGSRSDSTSGRDDNAPPDSVAARPRN